MRDKAIVNFVSGHLDHTEAEFDAHYRPRLDEALARGDAFVVGDARGTDTLTQNYLVGKARWIMTPPGLCASGSRFTKT
jgi:hypothetical protein